MISPRLALALGVALSLCVSGCEPAQEQARPFNPGDDVVNTAPPEHAHVHGPNGGHIVELGEEEFHAEVVFGGSAVGAPSADRTKTIAKKGFITNPPDRRGCNSIATYGDL